MPRQRDENGPREYLLVRGRLTRDDDFTPRRCGSTTAVRQWPEAEQPDHGDVVVETVDPEGRVLRSERPQIVPEGVCAPAAPTWRLRAYVPLDEGAIELRIRRGERVLWATEIGERPAVTVEVSSVPERGNGRKRETPGFPGGTPAVLSIDASRPVDPDRAYLKIVYRWAERGFHTVYAGPASRRVSIAADRLPGGARCEFMVVYSDGVRSATARTKPIKLDPIGPVLTIVRPDPDTTFTDATPIDVECLVQHPESPAVFDTVDGRTVWMLDGDEVATGSLSSIGPLPAGTYRLDVRYTGDGRRATAEAGLEIRVRESRAAAADTWPDHDPFTD